MSSRTPNQFVFGQAMRVWQQIVSAIVCRFLVLVIHRRAGKTEIALKKLLNASHKNQLDLPLYFYVAPYLKQAKQIAWARLKQMVSPLIQYGWVEINESELWVKFTHNGAKIQVFGADNPDAMRGVRLDGVVLDEVAQMKPEVWEEIIQPALSDRLGWAWFIGTPKGINLFSKLFYDSHKPEFQADGWASKVFTVDETNALDEDEVARLRRTMAEESFRREYLCDFTVAADNQLIGITDIIEAQKRVIPYGANSYAAKVIGVDPARFGNDRSAIFFRQGLASDVKAVYHGIDNMLLASKVAALIDEIKPDAVFIDAGNGSGVIDRLRQLGHDVIEVNFGGKPTDERFVNKRAEMWWEMAQWIKSGGALPKRDDIKQDLAAPTYSYDAANRIKLESKDDIKKRGIASPDLADALCLTFAFPVHAKSEYDYLKASSKPKDYDPYA